MILIYFMPQQDSNEKHNDLIDLIIQSAQKTVDVKNKDGTMFRELRMYDDIQVLSLIHISEPTRPN